MELALSDYIAATALLISLVVAVVQVHDRRLRHRQEERAVAEQVAGWVSLDRDNEEWVAHLRNASSQPVYDLLFVVRDPDDFDADFPEFIPVVPPGGTYDWPTDARYDKNRGSHRVYLTFRDGSGRVWQRDSHGRLSKIRRPVDNAPRADPVTGRIGRTHPIAWPPTNQPGS